MPSEEIGRRERAGSIASSHTETGGYEENEKITRLDKDEESLSSPRMLTDDHDMDNDDREDGSLLPQASEKQEPAKSSFASALIWMVVNTFATIGIVRTGLSLKHLEHEC